jgi:hypothetical protein
MLKKLKNSLKLGQKTYDLEKREKEVFNALENKENRSFERFTVTNFSVKYRTSVPAVSGMKKFRASQKLKRQAIRKRAIYCTKGSVTAL